MREAVVWTRRELRFTRSIYKIPISDIRTANSSSKATRRKIVNREENEECYKSLLSKYTFGRSKNVEHDHNSRRLFGKVKEK